MSPASSDSESSDMFESADFNSFDNGGVAFEEVDSTDASAGYTSPTPSFRQQQRIVQKGFSTNSFLLLISTLLMMASAIMLFSYMGSIK